MLLHTPREREADRKKLEQRIVRDGMQLWKNQQDFQRIRKMKEQKEMKDLLENYWPFEHSNDKIKPRGLRNLRLEGLFPNQDYQNAKKYVGTLELGRPGGGAPLVTDTGRKITRTRVDPILRFQFGNGDLRRCVDNTLRYKTNRKEQEEYRKELDRLIDEKKKLLEKIKKEEDEFDKRRQLHTNDGNNKETKKDLKVLKPFNRQRKLEPIFFYPGKNTYSRSKNRKLNPLSDDKENGIELVPILAKHHMPNKVPLGTTDVTNERKIVVNNAFWSRHSAYLRELTEQMSLKQQKLKEMKAKEMDVVQRHFSTWESFWGRPGHGAPRSAIKKQRLDQLLYPQMVPIGVH